MKNILTRYQLFCISFLLLLQSAIVSSQTNLLINGGFEDINTCTEYTAECGVEAWFYLKDVKAQMLSNETGNPAMGKNLYGIFYKWNEYKNFTPIIGTILPCGLQKGKEYMFRGLITAKLHPKLIFKPGICIGEKFYVPSRPFTKELRPDSIVRMGKLQGSSFYLIEYSFIANGKEKYLTFGTYIEEDFSIKGRKLVTPLSVSLVIDNFELIPADEKEIACDAFALNKEKIYAYNYRHREMDYALYGKGELAIQFPEKDSGYYTHTSKIPAAPQVDTLKLGDVFFDFNKAYLKQAALNMLSEYFINNASNNNIDSIYIEGHTDSIGSDKRNMELSSQRSESVKNWLLMNHVISEGNYFIHPFGRSRPIATNKTAQGRAMNRRVEIIIFRKRQ